MSIIKVAHLRGLLIKQGLPVDYAEHVARAVNELGSQIDKWSYLMAAHRDITGRSATNMLVEAGYGSPASVQRTFPRPRQESPAMRILTGSRLTLIKPK